MDKKDTISSKQLFGFIVASQIGFGILVLPSSLAEKTGHDGWIAVSLSGIIFSIVTIIIVAFLRKHKDKSLIEINKITYGKYLGSLFNIIYILYLYTFATIVMRAFVEVTEVMTLKATPSLILSLFLVCPAVYLIMSGFKVVCRFSNSIFLIIISTVFILILVIPELSFTYLMPVGETGAMSILKILPSITTSYLGVELLPAIYDTISDKEKTLKYSLRGHLVTILFFTIVVIITTAFFGEVLLQKLLFPLFSLSRAYKVPVIERLDLFFVSIWLPAMGTTVANYYFCSYYCISKLIQIKNRPLFFSIFFVASILLGIKFKDFNSVIKALDYLGYAGIGIVFSMFLSYALVLLRKNRIKS
jgi:spore germination protein (amino acid permease)